MSTSSKNGISLRPHQVEALSQLRTGSILLGGVGSGKTLTALAYFYTKVLDGTIGKSLSDITKPTNTRDLYVITTARKRDSLDWEREAAYLCISNNREISINGSLMTVDSWNNIGKYVDVEDAFFIFDEQKVVGSGAWAKTFVKIAKKNDWIMLTATPGDTCLDYISVFVANGFYRNRTEFIKEHVVYNRFANFPLVDRYIGEAKLYRLKNQLLVKMRFEKETVRHNIDIIVPYDEDKMLRVTRDRWNIFKDKPLQNAGEACYAMRQVVNSHPDRIKAIKKLAKKHKKLIVFYNFNYELSALRTLEDTEFEVAEYNGHLHQDIPQSDKWIYLVQYLSGAEAWNCIETNAIAFYSLNYSYKLTTQAAGRIDRMNTPFRNLYYYFIRSEASIDKGIVDTLKNKTNFNEKRFLRSNKLYF